MLFDQNLEYRSSFIHLFQLTSIPYKEVILTQSVVTYSSTGLWKFTGVCKDYINQYEPLPDKTNKMVCAPSEDSDQPGHPPSLIRVFTVRMKKASLLKYLMSAQRRLWSDWADAQADLSLRWAYRSFCWFCLAADHIKLRLRYYNISFLKYYQEIANNSISFFFSSL